ncbi:MAG: twin-arginine translocase TatA/TatE family subunit [Clostridiales bacterium]|nr:twin-arginine translocase TatA/TatE family subunit [Clostridiales bacterium]MCC8100315.1 twin-arginine translocase TatA/TatE family subunit [Clostridiales bacterium]MCD7858014.1 twin-arginine translocase TatA/TatE family subunit [Clostridiales bacterium]
MKIGVTELIVILLIVIVIFGPTQIPKLTKMLGSSIKNLREGLNGGEEKTAEESKSTDEQA